MLIDMINDFCDLSGKVWPEDRFHFRGSSDGNFG